MGNRFAYARAFLTAACTLAIALFTIGMGVSSSWAGSDPPSGLQTASMSSEAVSTPVPGLSHRSITMPRLKKLSEDSQPSTGPTTPTTSPSANPPCGRQNDVCGLGHLPCCENEGFHCNGINDKICEK
jgi:hypothetical protein